MPQPQSCTRTTTSFPCWAAATDTLPPGSLYGPSRGSRRCTTRSSRAGARAGGRDRRRSPRARWSSFPCGPDVAAARSTPTRQRSLSRPDARRPGTARCPFCLVDVLRFRNARADSALFGDPRHSAPPGAPTRLIVSCDVGSCTGSPGKDGLASARSGRNIIQGGAVHSHRSCRGMTTVWVVPKNLQHNATPTSS